MEEALQLQAEEVELDRNCHINSGSSMTCQKFND
jgi:hypothetical protein